MRLYFKQGDGVYYSYEVDEKFIAIEGTTRDETKQSYEVSLK